MEEKNKITETQGLDKPELISGVNYSKWSKLQQVLGWLGFSLVLLIFFTLIKLPEDRLKRLAIGSIDSFFNSKGGRFKAKETKFSVLFGPSLKLNGIEIDFAKQNKKIQFNSLYFYPSISDFLFGWMSGSFSLIQGKASSLQGKIAYKNSSKSSQLIKLHLEAQTLNIQDLALFELFESALKAEANLSGEINISGDLNTPQNLDGGINIKLSQIRLEPQSLFGFSIPKIQIRDGTLIWSIVTGKLKVQSFKLGQIGDQADDLAGALSGELKLGNDWKNSTIDFKVNFSLSDLVKKSFALIDALIGNGKQADGSYAFQITGTLGAPLASPIKP